MRTLELLNVCFSSPVPRDWTTLGAMTKANLPWAEDHFQERVGREPTNPGREYLNWPWWKQQDDAAMTHLGPDVPDRDWAYLAAFIDADGSIVIQTIRQKSETRAPRVSVYQRDRTILDELQKVFQGVGRIRHTETIHGGKHTWWITNREVLLWALPKLIPHLRIKRDRAIEALEVLVNRKPNGRAHPFLRPKMFTHSYQERFWPRNLGFGIRYRWGDLDDVVTLLRRYPTTRQAYLPIFNSEDTGTHHGGRVPCTLGYGFMRRDPFFNVWYTIRSCDAIRHFRDDVYLAGRLAQWVLAELKWELDTVLHFTAFSFHAHMGDLHVKPR